MPRRPKNTPLNNPAQVHYPQISESEMPLFSFKNFVDFLSNNFGVLFLVALFFIVGFLTGSLWTENQMLKNGSGGSVAGGQVAPAVDPGAQGPTEDQLKKVPKVTNDDHIRGNKDAKVVLIEYSDYECPYCNKFHPTMKQVMEKYGNQVAWVYRHYPLPFHTSAQRSAETGECVNKVGGKEAFWKFSDAVYTQVGTDGATALTPENLYKLAAAAGANSDKVKSCVDSGEMTQKVKDQMAAGTTAGISGTPGTIIVTKDGKYELIPGALPFEQVQPLLDKYLN